MSPHELTPDPQDEVSWLARGYAAPPPDQQFVESLGRRLGDELGAVEHVGSMGVWSRWVTGLFAAAAACLLPEARDAQFRPDLKEGFGDTRLRLLLAALGVVVLLAAAVHGLYYLGGLTWSASPEQLAQQALNESTVEEKTRAAVRLGDCGYEAREELRQVLQQSDAPEVRGACIQGIGAIQDYQSMDLLLEALEDEWLVVRGSAGTVVAKMVMGEDLRFSFQANAPEQEREKAVEALRECWEQLEGSPLLKQYYRRLEEGRNHEN